MNTDMIDSGTETGLGRLASLQWWGTVIGVIGGAVSFLAILGGILWHLATAQAERASIIETLASINKAVTENTADIKAIRTTVEANSAGIKANSAGIKANSADIKANSVGIAENRATIALVLKTSDENRNLLVLARGDIASLKQVQEEFGRQQRLLQTRQVEFSGKLEEFGGWLVALAESQARDAAQTRDATAAKIGDVEALVVDLDGRVKRLEDLILVSDNGAAAPSGGE